MSGVGCGEGGTGPRGETLETITGGGIGWKEAEKGRFPLVMNCGSASQQSNSICPYPPDLPVREFIDCKTSMTTH